MLILAAGGPYFEPDIVYNTGFGVTEKRIVEKKAPWMQKYIYAFKNNLQCLRSLKRKRI